MPVTQHATPQEINITLSQGVGIAEAETVWAQLKQAMDAQTPLVCVDLSAVSSADVCLFQMLLVAQAGLAAQRRHLMVQGLHPGHPVHATAAVLGLKLEHHLTLVESSP